MKTLLHKITKNKLWFITLLFFLLLTLFTSGYLIYSLSLLTGIENFLRTCARFVIVIIWCLFLLFSIRTLLSQKKLGFIVLIILSILYSGVLYFAANNVDRVIGKIGNISTNTSAYSSSIVTLKDNKANDIKEIGTSKIGMLADTTNIEGNTIPKEIINKNNLKNEIEEYTDFASLINALKEGKIEYIFLPTNYSIMFASIEGFQNLKEETKIIYTQTKEVKNTSNVNKGKKLDKPFTILLMGVDSELEEIRGSSFNGDSLMLITFNPDTLSTTVLSIPRDSYVPIACFTNQRKNKITHAAWYGESCMMKTIENFTGITIDYYAKINFKGVVKLVDALGGIDLDVEYSFCEQDSNRRVDGEHLIYVKKGWQTLNGEQALAYSRNRHTNPDWCSAEWNNYVSNDFIRGQHQQEVVRALLNKIKTIRSLDTFYELLDALSKNLETNVSTSEMLSLYNVAKDMLSKSNDNMDDLLGMQRLYLSGYDYYIYDYEPSTGQGMRLHLYNFVPYNGSIKDVTNAMKVNLGLIEKEPVKTFSFDVNTPYKDTVIGQGYYSEASLPLLKDLTGSTESFARSYANTNNITLNVEYVEATNSSQKIGDVINQSIPSGVDLLYVKSLTIKVVNKAFTNGSGNSGNSGNKTNCSLEENAENSDCAMPTFLGETKTFVENWFKRQGYDIKVTYQMKPSTDAGWSESVAGTVYNQSTTNAYLYDYINTGKEFIITYWEEVSTNIDDSDNNIDEEGN